jgi:hypothetical protein
LIALRITAKPRQYLQEAATNGLVLSGLVFWLVLAPVNGLGTHDTGLLTANLLLHLVSPGLATVSYLAEIAPHPHPPRLSARCMAGGYALLVVTASGAGAITGPYDFLSISRVGVAGAVTSAISAAALYLVIAASLITIRRRIVERRVS